MCLCNADKNMPDFFLVCRWNVHPIKLIYYFASKCEYYQDFGWHFVVVVEIMTMNIGASQLGQVIKFNRTTTPATTSTLDLNGWFGSILVWFGFFFQKKSTNKLKLWATFQWNSLSMSILPRVRFNFFLLIATFYWNHFNLFLISRFSSVRERALILEFNEKWRSK